MHIHIANIGEHPEPVKNGIRGIGNIDKVFLIYSKKFIEKASGTRNGLIDQGYTCEIIEVNGFDFQEIVDAIYRIYNDTYCKEAEYSINITGGTNLMAAAACSTAFFTGAKLYYIMYDPNNPEQSISERMISIPTPKIPDIKHLKDHEKSILKRLNEKKCESNSEIAEALNMSRQLCGRYLRELENNGLIESAIDSNDRRTHKIKLTKEGKMIANWF